MPLGGIFAYFLIQYSQCYFFLRCYLFPVVVTGFGAVAANIGTAAVVHIIALVFTGVFPARCVVTGHRWYAGNGNISIGCLAAVARAKAFRSRIIGIHALRISTGKTNRVATPLSPSSGGAHIPRTVRASRSSIPTSYHIPGAPPRHSKASWYFYPRPARALAEF